MGFEIRAGGREDAAAIADVHIESWRAGYAGLVPDVVFAADDFESSQTEMWSAWRFHPGQRVSVCTSADDDRIIGFAAYGPERVISGDITGRGELYAIYFLPDVWGDGSATALLEHVEHRLSADGYVQATLWVLENNPRAQAFYERQGWSPTGRRADYEAHGVPLPEIQYGKEL